MEETPTHSISVRHDTIWYHIQSERDYIELLAPLAAKSLDILLVSMHTVPNDHGDDKVIIDFAASRQHSSQISAILSQLPNSVHTTIDIHENLSIVEIKSQGVGHGDTTLASAVDRLNRHGIAIHRITMDDGAIQIYVPRDLGERAARSLERSFIAA